MNQLCSNYKITLIIFYLLRHQLSATALLGSPEGSRNPLDVYELAEEDYQRRTENNEDNNGGYNGIGVWECFIKCRHHLDQQLARRKVMPFMYLIVFLFSCYLMS